MIKLNTTPARSKNMSLIKGKNNRSTERRLIDIFRIHKIKGWRRNSSLFGKPDFIFPFEKIAVFVDGCFWHRCPKHSKIPKNNADFWQTKLEGNFTRDKLVKRILTAKAWKVIRIWEHDLKHDRQVAKRLQKLFRSDNSTNKTNKNNHGATK